MQSEARSGAASTGSGPLAFGHVCLQHRHSWDYVTHHMLCERYMPGWKVDASQHVEKEVTCCHWLDKQHHTALGGLESTHSLGHCGSNYMTVRPQLHAANQSGSHWCSRHNSTHDSLAVNVSSRTRGHGCIQAPLLQHASLISFQAGSAMCFFNALTWLRKHCWLRKHSPNATWSCEQIPLELQRPSLADAFICLLSWMRAHCDIR